MTARSPVCVFLINHAACVESGSTTGMMIDGMVARGHQVYVASADALAVDEHDHVCVRARRSARYGPHASAVERDASERELVLTTGDLVVIRTNPARDLPGPLHTLALDILSMAEARGVFVVNGPDGLRRASSKLYTHCIPLSMRPRTLVSRNHDALRSFVEAGEGSSVLKPVVGTRGADVFKVSGEDPNLNQIIEVLTRGGMAMAQAFVPEASEGDTRVLILDGAALRVGDATAAVRRVPNGRDFRSNVHVGAIPQPASYTPELRDIVEAVGPQLARDGLWLCGLDIIGNRVVEINVFSPGGLRDANVFCGVDFLEPILDFLERRLETPAAA